MNTEDFESLKRGMTEAVEIKSRPSVDRDGVRAALHYILKVGYNYGWQHAINKARYNDDFGKDLDITQLREPEASTIRQLLQKETEE